MILAHGIDAVSAENQYEPNRNGHRGLNHIHVLYADKNTSVHKVLAH